MHNIMKFVFLFSLLTSDVLGDRTRNRDYEEPQQGGKSFFFLGGLIRKIKSRWQNQNQPPSPYGGQPIFAGYYGCSFYNCRPPQQAFQVVQPVQAIQSVPAIQPLPAVVQTPIVVQQAQVYQPNAFTPAVAQPNSNPMYPAQSQSQQFQYPAQPAYGSPSPPLPSAYGNPQPYQQYPVYPSAYASPVPGPIYQNTGCTYPEYLCGRKT